jgi:putative FmdB family regulatory protein
MATYPYRCPDCNRRVEEYRPISHYNDVTLCPDCGQVMVRVFTVPHTCPAGLTSRKVPRGCVEVGNELDYVKRATPPRTEVSDREIAEWARTTTEFQKLPE